MIYLLLIALAAFFKAIADILASGNEVNILKNLKSTYFRKTEISWKRKYNFKTKFLKFLFTTVLVAFTDAWHAATLLMFISLFGLLSLGTLPLVEILFLITLFFMFFELFYRILKTTNKMNVTDILVLSAALMLIGGLGLNFELLNEVLTWKVMLGTGLITIITVGLTSIILMIKNN